MNAAGVERMGRRLGRVMLASSFIRYGLDCVRDPGEERIRAAARLGLPAPGMMVRLNGAVMAAGGALVASGVAPRLGIAALAASLVPTTLAGHAYWQHQDATARESDQIHFYKNVSLTGALVLLCTRTPPARSR